MPAAFLTRKDYDEVKHHGNICNMEYGFAKAKGIPVKFITTPEANAMGSEKCNRFFIDDGGQCSAPSCWDEDKRDYQIGVKCGGDKSKCCL